MAGTQVSMATTSSLVQSTPFINPPNLHALPWNPLFYSPPTRFPVLKPTHLTKGFVRTSTFAKPIRFACNCDARSSRGSNRDMGSRGKDANVIGSAFDGVVDKIISVLKDLRKPAVAIVLMGLLLMYDPNSSLAASGGRIGGSAFSSRSSSSSSSSSSSYSTRTPDSRFSYSVPYYAPTPFGGGGGFYVGPAFGFGLGAGSSFFFILMGFAAFILVSGFLSDRSDDGLLTATEKTSVLKIQVGLLGMARSLQKDLNQIAQAADTSTARGLSNMLTETTLALLRNPDYWISAYSSVDVKRGTDEGEKRFNQLSIEERGKFNEETLVNVNSIRRQSTSNQRSSGFSNEYIVVTILVAAEGVHKLPIINSSKDLKEALQKLGSIPSSKTMAVEVLWTPQEESDTLSERQLLEDYSLLRPL